MDDFLEQVARRRKQGLYTLLYVFLWFIVVISGLNAMIWLPQFLGATETGMTFRFIPLAIGLVSAGIAFLAWRRTDYCRVEYDYSFTNGILDVSKVLNNRRRRYLTALNMKDVVRCGPAKGPAFQKTLQESGLKKHNWFLNRDENVLLKVSGNIPADAFPHFILTDEAMSFTYVQPQKKNFGPYFCE